MNRITRMLAMTGLGLFAGVTIGAGPAMAAANTGQGAAKASVSERASWGSDDHLVDYFDSPGLCNYVGRNGERFGRWDDYDCYRVLGGFHDDEWALVVSWDDWNGHGWPGNHWPGTSWPGGWPGHHHGWPWIGAGVRP